MFGPIIAKRVCARGKAPSDVEMVWCQNKGEGDGEMGNLH